MNSKHCLLTFLIFVAGTPAQADNADLWFVCRGGHYVPQAAAAPHSGETAIYFWSEPFEEKAALYPDVLGQHLSEPFKGDYEKYIATRLDRDPQYVGVFECWASGTQAEAIERRTNEMRNQGTSRQVLVAPPSPEILAKLEPLTKPIAPPPKAVENAPSAITPSGPGRLTVEADTSLIEARKKYEQAVLQSQRDDAAARAKQIADTARKQAEMKAKLDKFFEQLRKRGSAQ